MNELNEKTIFIMYSFELLFLGKNKLLNIFKKKCYFIKENDFYNNLKYKRCS